MKDEFNETFEQLVLLIGKEHAKKVVDFFEGMSIYFPKRIGLNEQHEQIYTELQGGATYKTLSVKYGYTRAYIRRIEQKKLTERRTARAAMRGDTGVKYNANPRVPIRLKPQDAEQNTNTQGDLFYDR